MRELHRWPLAVLAGVLLAVLTPAAAPAYADSVRARQFSLALLGAEQAWQHSRGKGAVVAVLDSGVDASHPDLAGQVLDGYDAIDGTGDAGDEIGHGTAVATLIAGRSDDSGVVGLAPEAKILPVKVGEDQMYSRDVAEGIRWAVRHGADVINLSLGSHRNSDEVAEAVEYAVEHDVIVVAAAGNIKRKRDVPISYPARLPGVVAVTGITADSDYWSRSARGPLAALCAPASGVIAPYAGGYDLVSGTSFAAPMVAAAVALVRARWPRMSAANVVNRLLRTAKDLGREGRDSWYGFGRVDLERALTAKVPKVTEHPLLLPPDQRVRHPLGTLPLSPSPDRITVAWVLLLTCLTGLSILLTVSGWLLRRRPVQLPPRSPSLVRM